MTIWAQLISNLTEDDRKSLGSQIKGLSFVLHQCEGRLQRYGAGEDTVLKLLYDMETTRDLIAEIQGDLIKRHKLPGLPTGKRVRKTESPC